MSDDEWMSRANCIGLDSDLFFTGRGESQSDAYAVCQQCEVVHECLTYALETREVFGVWGRAGERTRRHLRKRINRGEPVDAVVAETLARPPSKHAGRPKRTTQQVERDERAERAAAELKRLRGEKKGQRMRRAAELRRRMERMEGSA